MTQPYKLVDLPPNQIINPAQLKEKFTKESVYVIDVRNSSEIQNPFPQSINIPLCDVENALKSSNEDFKAKYGTDKPPSDGSNVVFLCGKGTRGSMATDLASNLGLVKAQNLDGGFRNWVEKGFAS